MDVLSAFCWVWQRGQTDRRGRTVRSIRTRHVSGVPRPPLQ